MADNNDPTSIGSILVSRGWLTREQAAQLEQEQQQIEREALFGYLAVTKGYCTPDQIDEAIKLQARMRNGNGQDRSLLAAELSIARHRSGDMAEKRRRVEEKGQQLVEALAMHRCLAKSGSS